MKRFILKTKEIRANAADYVAHLPGDPLSEVIIQHYVEDKTREQEAFFHVLCRELCKDTGYTEGEIKELIKQDILGTTVVKFAGREKEVTASSANQPRPKYSELIEGAYRIGAEAGIVLPNPRYQS